MTSRGPSASRRRNRQGLLLGLPEEFEPSLDAGIAMFAHVPGADDEFRKVGQTHQ